LLLYYTDTDNERKYLNDKSSKGNPSAAKVKADMETTTKGAK